ncbi:hypothetical protein COV16_00440 [Candidatus Woesearchaeota archaeon CG10_big_fil_rev_8_21_14_0_10_34_8]|nr:MAG: hypothetical protein COV16_00440 [Candidatus Woesearchaeota archaeon CG10_big_fil_rev_8_21_14_0_10_34_8]
MKKGTIYIDSCIFVSQFLKEEKYKIILGFMKEIENSSEFVSSDWAITETVKVLIKEKKKSPSKVANFIQKLIRTSEIDGIRFKWIKTEGTKKNYTFETFFYEIQQKQLKFKGSLGDVIHGIIMNNNNVKTILSTDSEFEGMKKVILINPLKKDFKR